MKDFLNWKQDRAAKTETTAKIGTAVLGTMLGLTACYHLGEAVGKFLYNILH